MEFYGLDFCSLDWSLFTRRVINNPTVKSSTISKTDFKLFIKIFRRDYESHREEILQEMLKKEESEGRLRPSNDPGIRSSSNEVTAEKIDELVATMEHSSHEFVSESKKLRKRLEDMGHPSEEMGSEELKNNS